MDISPKTMIINLYKLKNFILCTLLCFLCACASQSDWSTVADWDKFDDSDLPDQEDYPDAGAVILLDEGVVEISDGGEIDFTYFERHRVVKILNTSGYSYANVSIGYNESSDVEMIEARTVSPDGKITVLDEENIFDITLYPRFVFFSDQRAKIFTFPAVEEGCILEYKYRLTMSGNTLMHSWYFQNNSPTEVSRFSLKTPSIYNIDFKLYNIDIVSNVARIPSTERSIQTWEARDVMEFPKEIAMPPAKNIAARIEVSPLGFYTWADVAKWYHGLSESQMIVDDEISQIAVELTADIDDEQEKVQRLFEWVRDEVRYVAVSIGIGGFKPHSSDEILLNRYGDCKDMTTLFCSVARAVDIPVQQVLISTHPNGNVDTSLVSPFQFNHVIAYYPIDADSGLWLDATKKGNPFGFVPWYNQDRLAFIVDEEGIGRFKRTPSHRASENTVAMEWNIELDKNLAAVVNGKNIYTGAPATDMRQSLINHNDSQTRKWVEGYLSTRCSGINLQSFSISNVDTVQDPLTIRYTFNSDLLASQSENMAIIDPAAILLMELPELFRSKHRNVPIEFKHGSSYHLKLAINVPDSWEISTPVRNDSVLSDYGRTFWKWQKTGKGFSVEHQYNLPGFPVPKDLYTDYRDFLEAVNEQDNVPVILMRK
jgi:hypothetical protein